MVVRTILRVAALVVAIACGIVLANSRVGAIAANTGYPTLSSSGTPDPQDVAAIHNVIQQADWVEGLAARTFDTTLFPTVFVNDSAIQLSQE